MRTIAKINTEWRKNFKRERLKLITNWEFEKVDVLENLIIKDVYWIFPYDRDEWGIEFSYKEKVSLYTGYRFIIKTNEKTIDFSLDESSIIYDWLERKLNIKQYISMLEEEKE